MFFAWRVVGAFALLVSAAACGSAGNAPQAASTETAPASSPPASGGQVVGTVAATVAAPSALMVLEPASDVELPVKSEPAVIDQAGYEFLPGFLVAQAGQILQFRNSEDVLHNVRVTNTAAQQPVFNIATAPFGTYEHKLEPGFYNVTCDIHPTMRASILVTRTPYTAITGADGSFAIENVRPGPYKLTIYAGPQPVVRSVAVKSGRTDLGVVQ